MSRESFTKALILGRPAIFESIKSLPPTAFNACIAFFDSVVNDPFITVVEGANVPAAASVISEDGKFVIPADCFVVYEGMHGVDIMVRCTKGTHDALDCDTDIYDLLQGVGFFRSSPNSIPLYMGVTLASVLRDDGTYVAAVLAEQQKGVDELFDKVVEAMRGLVVRALCLALADKSRIEVPATRRSVHQVMKQLRKH